MKQKIIDFLRNAFHVVFLLVTWYIITIKSDVKHFVYWWDIYIVMPFTALVLSSIIGWLWEEFQNWIYKSGVDKNDIKRTGVGGVLGVYGGLLTAIDLTIPVILFLIMNAIVVAEVVKMIRFKNNSVK
ncbi:hypothetical protein [Flavobacterium sp.]